MCTKNQTVSSWRALRFKPQSCVHDVEAAERLSPGAPKPASFSMYLWNWCGSQLLAAVLSLSLPCSRKFRAVKSLRCQLEGTRAPIYSAWNLFRTFPQRPARLAVRWRRGGWHRTRSWNRVRGLRGAGYPRLSPGCVRRGRGRRPVSKVRLLWVHCGLCCLGSPCKQTRLTEETVRTEKRSRAQKLGRGVSLETAGRCPVGRMLQSSRLRFALTSCSEHCFVYAAGIGTAASFSICGEKKTRYFCPY